MFDTPPYTTQQGVTTILELPTEWSRDAPPKMTTGSGGGGSGGGKTGSHYVFKPSLLADLSHTSSSAPSNRSERLGGTGSTLGSSLHSNNKVSISTLSLRIFVCTNIQFIKLKVMMLALKRMTVLLCIHQLRCSF